MSGRKRSSIWVVSCFGLFVLAAPLTGNAFRRQMGESATTAEDARKNIHPVFVELFTSEGCSSCPPADSLLARLDADQPIPGAQLIVLSEHVDYWDHDGWRDPNSSALLTERQSSYEHALGRESPYTPQMIVDGVSEARLNNPRQIENVLEKAIATPTIPVRISELSVDAANSSVLRVRIETDTNSQSHNADVYVAIALNRFESQVLRGENGGKRLTSVAVVQQLTKIGKLPKGKSFNGEIQLKLKPATDPRNIRLIAFVQEPGPGRVLGAASRKPAI